MKIITKQGNLEGKINVYGYEHEDIYTKLGTAIDAAGERKIVGKTTRISEKNVVLPIGSDVDLEMTTLICKTEDGETHFVEGELPLLKKDLLPVTNKIKSSCSIGGSRVADVNRKLKSEAL